MSLKANLRAALEKAVEIILQRPAVDNTIIDPLFPHLVTIGKDFVSSAGSKILCHDASYLNHGGKYGVAPVKVGDRVFLGSNAIILMGVTMGDDVVIGAGAVVTKDVESGVVVAGNPARVVCTIDEYLRKAESRPAIQTIEDAFANNPAMLAAAKARAVKA